MFIQRIRSVCGLLCSVCALSGCALCATTVQGQQPQPVSIDFARDVRPLLSDRCFACHGPDAEDRQADLRVDQWDELIRVRGQRPVVRPGHPNDSELIRRITSVDPDERMPPAESGQPLSEQEIQTLTNWIEAGAEWQQHWAYEVPRATTLPVVDELVLGASGPGLRGEHWIDGYIAQTLADQSGTFSPQADQVTLARRLSFDLTGLPPTPQQLQQLQSDTSPASLDNYIDRLLASPACGERLASYWLDLVRFADTVGYHGDQDHHISPYRDYVIDAFNDNRGFDQFTIEQLAGDLLPQPTGQPIDEQIIATGYNRMLQTSHEGGVQAKEYLAIYAADRVRNVSAVWMGATVGCAQCHDHKFDPYTARDFYALAAFFADVDEEQHLRRGSDSIPTQRAPEKSFLDRSQRLQREQLQQQLAEAARATSADGSQTETVTQLQHQLEQLQAAARKTMITVSIEPRTVRYLPRGNWLDDSGEIMTPRAPEFLEATYGSAAGSSAARPTRLDLARWLVDAKQGVGLLTARVQVNRLWMLMFGEGLSRSVDDFGGQGEAPSHPELLDRLAIEFVRSGWDIKYMLREMARTRTYRQSSLETAWHRTHDPLNRWLARQNRFRLPAEMVRDTALACSDLLVQQLGGSSVKPYQPEGYYRHLNFPTRTYQASTDQGQWRRGVYVHWQRQFLHPMMIAFDAPRREECTAQRTRSNTPLAALVWLNDPSFVEAARALALRTLPHHPADQERIEWMFRKATSRSPDPHEQKLLLALLEQARAEYATHPDRPHELLEVGQLRIPSDFPPAELAAWTNVARAVLNLNETYTRN
jgi:hypothetical protein